jgi:hypothetical protein
MTAFRPLATLGAVVLLVSGGVSAAVAQSTGKGPQGSPMYDVKTETTLTGTVENVETVTGKGGRGRQGLGGTHLLLKTDKESIQVHVGPTAYLTEKGITLAKGEALEILGSRVTIGDDPVLIAKQIKKGDKTWTLREASGRPLWSGGQR